MKLDPNWPTTFWGAAFTAAAYITANPTALDAVLDPEITKKIASICLLITGYVAFSRTKDKSVTGNGSLDAPNRVKSANGYNEPVN